MKKLLKYKNLLHLILLIFVISTSFYIIKNFVNASSQYAFSMKFGSQGSGDGQFLYYVETMAVDHLGNIYVGEGHSNPHIQKFDSNGNFVNQFSPYPGMDGAIAVDLSNNLYVTNYNLSRIEEFAPDQSFIKTFGWGVLDGTNAFQICEPISHLISDCHAGIMGGGDGQFSGIGYLNIDSVGNIYIPDWNNNWVQKFDSGGHFLMKFGSGGSGDGQFDTPESAAVDSNGNIYVTDYNMRVQKFDSSGNFITKWGSQGFGPEGKFFYPNKITIDSHDNLFVFDSGLNRIQEFDVDGNFISMFGVAVKTGAHVFEVCTSSCRAGLYIATDGGFRGQIDYGDLAVDANDNVYATDMHGYRVQKFSLVYTPEINTISPNIKFLNDTGVTIDVSGNDFNSDSVVNFNNSPRVTYFDTSSHLTADLTGADFSTLGTFPITVTNPTPTSRVSNVSNLLVIDGSTSATAATFGVVNGNNLAGQTNAGYDFSYASNNTGTLSSLTITFPVGYVITNGDLTSGVFSYPCGPNPINICFNNSETSIISATGNSINNTITITFNPIIVTGPFNLSFTIEQGIQNPTLPSQINGSDFSFLDDMAGSTPIHSSFDNIIIPAVLDHFLISNISDHFKNSLFDFDLTAKDSFNNTITDFTGTVNVTSTGHLSSGSGTSTSFVGGILNHSVKFSNTGKFNITVTHTGGSESSTSNSFKITSPPQIGQTCGNCPPPPPPDPCTLNPSSCIQKEIIKTCPEDPTKCPPPPQQ
ncbi:MAG: 6-bladed beta-propeller, partial [Candidatus Nomurabacteria bacterium]|nr:6-bladed beta-propeller [Candidatus Nomurabacteria bacterium]